MPCGMLPFTLGIKTARTCVQVICHLCKANLAVVWLPQSCRQDAVWHGEGSPTRSGLMQFVRLRLIHVQLTQGEKPKQEKCGDSRVLCGSFGTDIPDISCSCLYCKLDVRPFVLMTRSMKNL